MRSSPDPVLRFMDRRKTDTASSLRDACEIPTYLSITRIERVTWDRQGDACMTSASVQRSCVHAFMQSSFATLPRSRYR